MSVPIGHILANTWVESLAKLLYATADSAFILFRQESCSDLKLTLAPTQTHALESNLQSHKQM